MKKKKKKHQSQWNRFNLLKYTIPHGCMSEIIQRCVWLNV